MSTKYQNLYILLLLALICAFALVTMMPSQSWSDDFALYILHAINISQGNNYSDTGFIYNQDAFTYSPVAYPPGLPVILAPVYAIFGINFIAMKIVILIFYLLFLYCTFIFLRNKTDFISAFISIIFLGFSTGLWVLRDNIIGDFPAAFFILATILFIEKQPDFKNIGRAVILAILIYLNYSLRPTGLLIFPAWVIYCIYKKEWSLKIMSITGLLVVALCSLQSKLINGESNYFSMLSSGYEGKNIFLILLDVFWRIIGNIQSLAYLTNSGDYFRDFNFAVIVNMLLTLILFMFFVIGILKNKQISVFNIFAILYLLVIFIFPGFQVLRYLIPVLPLYFLYIIKGFYAFKYVKIKQGLLYFAIFFYCYISIRFFIVMTHKYSDNRIGSEASEKTLKFISENINAEDVLMCQRPRAITLLTGVKSTSFPELQNPEKLMKNIEEYNVGFIMITQMDYNEFPISFIEEHNDQYRKIWNYKGFQIYAKEPSKILN